MKTFPIFTLKSKQIENIKISVQPSAIAIECTAKYLHPADLLVHLIATNETCRRISHRQIRTTIAVPRKGGIFVIQGPACVNTREDYMPAGNQLNFNDAMRRNMMHASIKERSVGYTLRKFVDAYEHFMLDVVKTNVANDLYSGLKCLVVDLQLDVFRAGEVLRDVQDNVMYNPYKGDAKPKRPDPYFGAKVLRMNTAEWTDTINAVGLQAAPSLLHLILTCNRTNRNDHGQLFIPTNVVYGLKLDEILDLSPKLQTFYWPGLLTNSENVDLLCKYEHFKKQHSLPQLERYVVSYDARWTDQIQLILTTELPDCTTASSSNSCTILLDPVVRHSRSHSSRDSNSTDDLRYEEYLSGVTQFNNARIAPALQPKDFAIKLTWPEVEGAAHKRSVLCRQMFSSDCEFAEAFGRVCYERFNSIQQAHRTLHDARQQNQQQKPVFVPVLLYCAHLPSNAPSLRVLLDIMHGTTVVPCMPPFKIRLADHFCYGETSSSVNSDLFDILHFFNIDKMMPPETLDRFSLQILLSRRIDSFSQWSKLLTTRADAKVNLSLLDQTFKLPKLTLFKEAEFRHYETSVDINDDFLLAVKAGVIDSIESFVADAVDTAYLCGGKRTFCYNVYEALQHYTFVVVAHIGGRDAWVRKCNHAVRDYLPHIRQCVVNDVFGRLASDDWVLSNIAAAGGGGDTETIQSKVFPNLKSISICMEPHRLYQD